jgi:predicted phosphodiesterase
VRYGVLSDIHGNLTALEAVLERLRAAHVDRYLIAGDLVGYGPFPNECADVVRDLDATCVSGNHDLIAIGRLSDTKCIGLARETLAWTREVMRDDVREYLETLPPRAEVGGIVLAHGSLDDPEAYTALPDRAAAQLHRLRSEYTTASILILGHTHRPLAFAEEQGRLRIQEGSAMPIGTGRCLLNPGAVGQSREFRARARYLVLDLEERRATFHAIPYDLGSARRALRRQGLPLDACHRRPSLKRAVGRTLRRRLLPAIGRARSYYARDVATPPRNFPAERENMC